MPDTICSNVAPTPSEQALTIMLWLVATGFFIQTLDSTIVNTALPAMAKSLGEAPLSMPRRRVFPAEQYLPVLSLAAIAGLIGPLIGADSRRLDRVVALDLPDQRAGGRDRLHRDAAFHAR